jgi:hypothetical protein
VNQWNKNLQGSPSSKQAGLPRKWFWSFITGVSIFLVGFFFVLVAVPAVSPATGAGMADLLREILGPRPVAVLESVSFRLHDMLNRNLSHASAPQINWDASMQPTPSAAPAQLASLNSPKVKADKRAVVSAMPQIGWQAYGPEVNGISVMARALLSLDPKRPYAGVALVRMDLSQLQLHVMPGTMEPARTTQLLRLAPDLGMIPASDQGSLIASFNGGFKTVNGRFGMMIDGLTLVNPIRGAATVALYKDGHVQIGAWGTDIISSKDMVAYRQNCLLLVSAGEISSDVSYNNPDQWGYTNNKDITWRTGLGISQDGRYLIYAVGNGTDVNTLAQALKDAGAYSAMQLDINQYYAHFETYQPNTSGSFKLEAERLLDKMINERHIYLFPNPRDFFYLTAR